MRPVEKILCDDGSTHRVALENVLCTEETQEGLTTVFANGNTVNYQVGTGEVTTLIAALELPANAFTVITKADTRRVWWNVDRLSLAIEATDDTFFRCSDGRTVDYPTGSDRAVVLLAALDAKT